jgi:hypothetical protein
MFQRKPFHPTLVKVLDLQLTDFRELQDIATEVAGCARPAPAPSPPPRPGEADISIGADRPSSIVRPRSCQQQIR